jgi:hypothetical protein
MASRAKSLSARAAALLLLAAFLAAQFLPIAGPKAGGAVEATAIETGAALEFCPHHPEGCPKECMCPKIRSEADSDDVGSVRQPTLARCSGKAKVPAAEALGGGLPLEPDRIALLPRAEPVAPARATTPSDPFREDPAKVPIA